MRSSSHYAVSSSLRRSCPTEVTALLQQSYQSSSFDTSPTSWLSKTLRLESGTTTSSAPWESWLKNKGPMAARCTAQALPYCRLNPQVTVTTPILMRAITILRADVSTLACIGGRQQPSILLRRGHSVPDFVVCPWKNQAQ
jgi:hypothetical protein